MGSMGALEACAFQKCFYTLKPEACANHQSLPGRKQKAAVWELEPCGNSREKCQNGWANIGQDWWFMLSPGGLQRYKILPKSLPKSWGSGEGYREPCVFTRDEGNVAWDSLYITYSFET